MHAGCSDSGRPALASNRRQHLRAFLLRLAAWLLRLFRRPASRKVDRSISRAWIVRPDHLGDFLFATPALDRWLQATGNNVHTTLSVGTWCAELARHGPEVEHLELFPYPGFTRNAKGQWWSPYRALIRQARCLRREQYDMAIILRFDHWWAGLLACLAGIPHRIGYDTDPLRHCLTSRVPYQGTTHEVERNLTLIDHALTLTGYAPASSDDGFPDLIYHVQDKDRDAMTTLLAEHRITAGLPMVIIHPGAGAAVKEWPAQRFAAVADALIAEMDATVVLTGASGDLGVAWKVAAYMHEDALVLAGQTSIGELGALLEGSNLVIGSDSGPLHLAVAVGAPSLHLYGPVDPAMFGPWSAQPDRHRVLMVDCDCAPCNHLDFSPAELLGHRCMETISVDQVVDAARAMLAGNRHA